MLDAYFEPIKLHELYGSDPFPTDALGSTIAAYTKDNNFPAFEGAQIAIIGIGEDRGSVGNQGCGEGVDAIRNKFYQLKCHSKSLRIIDLGNLKVGYSLEDTYAAVATVISELIPLHVIPILIGGSQDLTYAQYLGYKKVEKIINIVSVDSRFDLGKPDQEMNSASFLGKIIMEQPNYLFNFSNLGYQTYFVGNESVELMNKLYFDTHRLGQIRTDIEDAEPIIRNADLITVDISSIRQCDAPGNRNSSPNGFYGEEICQIMMYAGISDKLSGLGIYEYNPLLDREGQTAHLVAQMMWYFLEGIGNRKADIPANNPAGYITYRVPMTNIDQEITFLKSIKSNRWWMKLPVELAKNRFMSHHLIPCSYKDYQQACKSEVPDKWWNAIQKLS
jgi:formiminoglutamase